MKRALLCSGQGRIGRGMLDAFARLPAAAVILETARWLLGRDPVDLLAEGDEEVLTGNRTGQILCATRALCAHAWLGSDVSAMVAGYSVGEMAAWSVAGIWGPVETLHLVAARAAHMDKADGGVGGLGFIRGLDERDLTETLDAYDCAIAIRNPDRVFIIGGARAAVAACCDAALARGASGARPIPVHVASHTPRLSGAVAPFLDLLSHAPGRPVSPGRLLIGAADALPIGSARDGVAGLARQIARTVDWEAVLLSLVERGAGRVLELGPGDALATMIRATWPQVEARSIDDFRTPEGARSWFEA